MAVFAVASQAQTCSSTSPTDAARSLYQEHYAFIHEGAGSPPLSPSLQQLVAANIEQNLSAGETGAIDWDFWTDAQDGEAAHAATATLVHERKPKAVVRLHYSFVPSPTEKPRTKITDVQLVRSSSGCWLVDDLLHNKQSLRRLLRLGTQGGAKR